jgi:hypothetical protein
MMRTVLGVMSITTNEKKKKLVFTMVFFQEQAVEFAFLDFHYFYYYYFWVYFSFSSFPRFVVKMQIRLHSHQRFESGGGSRGE